MAGTPTLPGIANSWSLREFFKIHGAPKYAPNLKNSTDGSEFSALMFHPDEDRDSRIMVAFSSNLGVLSMEDIKLMRDELQIVLLNSGNYALCKSGANSWISMADLFD